MKNSILIVGDNISMSKSLFLILEKKGYEVYMAEEGTEAIKMVGYKSFDIIFMDIKMPLMNGVEAYKRIKKIRPDSTVYMMTAYAVEELVKDALKEGARGILYKPLDIDQVLELIEEEVININSR